MSKERQKEHILQPPSIEKSVSASLESPFFSQGEWPQAAWWEIFSSPELNSLIGEAISANPSIQAIDSRLKKAEAETTIAKSSLFPLLFFDMTESWEYISKNGLYRALNPTFQINPNILNLSLSMTYEVDFWGKYRNLFKAALGEQKAQEAEVAQVVLTTTTAVAQAFFALKTNLVKEALYEQLYLVRKESFQLAQLLNKKALFSKLPPLLSEENLLATEKLLFSIREEVATNRHLLNILVGKSPDRELAVDASLTPLPDTIALPSNLSLDLLARRPDLMAQIWRVEALAHQVGAAKADFYPNVNLTALAGLASAAFGNIFQGKSKTGMLNPAINLPIFTAGAIRANVRSKLASFDEAVYTYNNLLLQSAQEVADLLVFADSIYSQKQAQMQIVKDAQERYDITSLRAEKGLDSFFSVYAYQEALIKQQLDDITLLYNQYLAVVKLTKALGGGYVSSYQIPLKAEGVEK